MQQIQDKAAETYSATTDGLIKNAAVAITSAVGSLRGATTRSATINKQLEAAASRAEKVMDKIPSVTSAMGEAGGATATSQPGLAGGVSSTPSTSIDPMTNGPLLGAIDSLIVDNLKAMVPLINNTLPQV
ncbi:unnamed protein product, partial [Pylaiella littoralis]